nr:flavodoxin [uncultured Dorea sp.]
MKKWITVTLSLLAVLSLMACSNSSDAESEKKSTEKSQTVTDTDDKKQNVGEKRESGNGQSGDAGAKDTVVVYFSGTGNTKKVAEKLSEELPADILEIVPAEAYTSEDLDYNDRSRYPRRISL